MIDENKFCSYISYRQRGASGAIHYKNTIKQVNKVRVERERAVSKDISILVLTTMTIVFIIAPFNRSSSILTDTTEGEVPAG